MSDPTLREQEAAAGPTVVAEALRAAERATNGPIHGFFGLSYSNYLVLPRTLMQSMPVAWQERADGK